MILDDNAKLGDNTPMDGTEGPFLDLHATGLLLEGGEPTLVIVKARSDAAGNSPFTITVLQSFVDFFPFSELMTITVGELQHLVQGVTFALPSNTAQFVRIKVDGADLTGTFDAWAGVFTFRHNL